MKYKNIILCGNFFKSFIDDQFKHPITFTDANWRRLIVPMLDRLECNVTSFHYKTFLNMRDNATKIAALNLHDILSLCEEGSDLSPYFDTHHFADSLVVGVEIPSSFCRYLRLQGVPYINIMVGPIRFLNDLTFGVATNMADIYKAASQWAVNQEYIYGEADRIRAVYLGRVQNISPDNSLLIPCQTIYDSSLIKNGRFLYFLDFEDEIIKRGKNFDHVAFLIHPESSNNGKNKMANEQTVEMAKKIGDKARIISGNPYAILSQLQYSSVLALNSSMILEARYFGKETHHLLPLSYERGGAFIEKDAHHTLVSKGAMTTAFWKHILGINTYADKGEESMMRDNALRHVTAGYWGYKDLMDNNRQFDFTPIENIDF